MTTKSPIIITQLYSGAHSPDSQMCLLEAVAYVNGEPWGDSPDSVCPVLATFGRAWNDGMRSNEERAQLLPYVLLLAGTRSTPEVETIRAFMALDWLVRRHAPAWLRLAGLVNHAFALESLEEIDSLERMRQANPTLLAAGDASWVAARAAAGDALEPTVLSLQAEAHELFHAMIAVASS